MNRRVFLLTFIAIVTACARVCANRKEADTGVKTDRVSHGIVEARSEVAS